MKKIKPLFLVLLMAAVLMGAGYAAWTDHTTINGTISTGVMDVEIDTGKYLKPTLTVPDYVGKTEPVVSADKNSVTFGISDLYPTVYKWDDLQSHGKLHMQIQNNGTVPVKLESIELIPDDPNNPALDQIKVAVFMHHSNNPTGSTSGGGNGWNSLTGQNAVEGYLKDLATIVSTTQLQNFTLYPGHVIRFGGFEDPAMNSFRFWLPQNSDNDSQSQDIIFTLKFNWKQFNM